MGPLKNLLLVVALFFSAAASHAQVQPVLGHTVRGTVVDSKSGRPVAAVSVSVPGRSYATVTNDDGVFVVKSDTPIRELLFTRLGYRSRRQPVSGSPLRVKLVPEAYELTESSIVSGDPYEIVKAAVEKIPANYARRPELLRCFYRETLQKRQRYTYVAEAVARIYKTAYDIPGIISDRAALDKSRVIISQRMRDTLSVKMQGGPNMAIGFDAVKNGNVLFNPYDMPCYAYEMAPPAYIGDRLQFVIHISPDAEADYALYYGTLYIDRETLLFTRIELSLDMSDVLKATRAMLVRKPLSLRFTPKELSYVMNYKVGANGAQLEYFRSGMRFNCDWKKRLIRTSYTVVNELVVTDVIEPAAQIPRGEMFRTADVLGDRAAEFFDPDFWKDYNIIEASESLENAIGKLKKQ